MNKTKTHRKPHQLKFLLPLFSLLFSLFSSSLPAFAAYTENWEIDQFNSKITIEENGDILVTETIDADFTNESHRGLERQIPYDYVGGYNSRFELQNVQGDWHTETSDQNGYFIIQMTTPDNSQISEKTSFTYSYILKNAILDQKDFQELYWNVNGTEWPIKTAAVKTTITLPKNLTQTLETICFTGDYGSSEQNCTIDQQTNQITFKTTAPLNEYQGLTIGLKLPSGTVTPPTLFERLIWFLLDHPSIFLPFLTFIIMLSIFLKYGRDEKTLRTTIIPHYTAPKNLLPGETGTLIDEKLDPQDITATIIDFAIKGFIQIDEIKDKDYQLTLKKPYKTTKPYEEIILQAIFPENITGSTKKISDLKNKFHKTVTEIDKAIMEDLVKENYFPASPSKTRLKYMGVGGTICFISIYIMQALVSLGVSAFICGGIILIFGNFMPRKTQKGKETYYELRGLYEYINTAEKDRIKFQEDHHILFEKLLPYAMAFGLAKKWTKAFEGILMNNPTWYHPLTSNGFNMIYFANSINSFNTSMTNNINSQPGGRGGSGGWSGGSSFGGGGFSGGGFSGGGGRGL